MEIIRVDETTVAIRRIDMFFVDLLRQIPLETSCEDDAYARDRIFSAPMEDLDDDLNQEWKMYVEPEMRHLFQSANETVARDLETLERSKGEEDEVYSISIPVKHLDQWLNTLNQARLVLAARNKFTDQELSAEFSPVINSKRDMKLLQIHVYGFLQEIFLRELT